MSAQLGFPGFGDGAPTDRLFFGVFPPAPVAERIAGLAQDLRAEHGLTGRTHAPDRLHITLCHLGDFAGVPANLLAQAREAAAMVSIAPFEVSFDRAASFSSQPRNRPFVLQGGEGVVAVKAMREALVVALARVGAGKFAKTQFTPHMTLLYDDKAVEERPVEPVGWTVDGFILIHSLLGQTRHIPLDRWSLQA